MKITILAMDRNDYAPQHILSAAQKNKHTANIVTWKSLALQIGNSRHFFEIETGTSLDFDALIPRSPSDKPVSFRHLFYLLLQFSRERKAYFLNQEYFLSYQSDNKMAQQYHLNRNNLPGVPTFSKAPETYPFVAKAINGSHGSEVMLIRNKADLANFQRTHPTSTLYQTYIPFTHDYRVIVIGEKAIGAVERTPQNGEWRANVDLGANVHPVLRNDSPDIYSLAEKAAAAMKLDYVGIDILRSSKGLFILETNSLAQFEGFEQAFPHISVGERIIKLIETKSKN